MFATMSLTSAYAVVAVLTPGSLAAGKLVGAASEWLFIPVFALMAVMLLVFPSGLLPLAAVAPRHGHGPGDRHARRRSLRRRPPPGAALPAPGGASLVYDNPVALERLGSFGGRFGSLNGLAVVYLVLLALALVALVVRHRQGSTEVRQQILWVVLVVGVGLALQVLATLAQVACGCAQSPSPPPRTSPREWWRSWACRWPSRSRS